MSGFTEAVITAGELHAGHIGETIRWSETHPERQVVTVRTAELRQLHHNGNDTSITYGVGANDETTLAHGHPIVLGPADDYTDYSLWKGSTK